VYVPTFAAATKGGTSSSSSTAEAKALLFTSPNRDGARNKSSSALWGDDDDDDDEDGLFVAKMSKLVQDAEPTAVAQAVASAGGTGNLFGEDGSDSDELFE
jgi:hypothetical protein